MNGGNIMAEISLCMIVKNEEKVLARCLESIKNAVDEIIIVDTGSTDTTKKIALKYTDKVYDFKWIDDFSAARNYTFSKGSKDFLMWLDADDIISPENSAKLIALKEQLNGIDIVMMKYHTAFDEEGRPTFSFYRERLIRRSIPHKWKGKVHEAVDCKGITLYSDIAIEHHSVKKEYSTRNLEIYEKQAAEGGAMQPRDVFYYGRELYYHKKYGRAIETLSSFLADEKGWVENKLEACKLLSLCYSETGDTDKALEALFDSFKYDAPRAEICCAAGNLFMNKSDYNKAIFWYELALTLPKNEQNGGFNELDSYGYLPCIQLCVCYDKLKDYKKAEDYNLKAGKFRPKSEAYLHNIKYFDSLHTSGVL